LDDDDEELLDEEPLDDKLLLLNGNGDGRGLFAAFSFKLMNSCALLFGVR
jgi:hypothetical protein